jgi:hypothetical protein
MTEEYWNKIRLLGVNTEGEEIHRRINKYQDTEKGRQRLWNAYYSMCRYPRNGYPTIKNPTAFYITAVDRAYT